MAVEIPVEVEKWGKFVENSILTAYYRLLSFVSLHAPISEIYNVCKYLSENTDYGGDAYWLIENRVANWDSVIVNQNPEHPVTMNLRIFGSPIRNRNTCFARVGFWKMYALDVALSFIGSFLRR